jgi:hypothetical protein
MSDAAEVLDAIYQQINAATGAAGVEALFGSALREEVHCADCGRTTQQSAYTQYFFNTQVGGAGPKVSLSRNACSVLSRTACPY